MRFGEIRSNRRLALLGLAVLVLVGVGGAALALTLGGGGSSNTLPTTGAYAPISVPKPIVVRGNVGFAGPVVADPDSMIRQGSDLQTLIASAPGRNRYTLTVTNVSGIGYINSFKWYPPTGVTIVKLIGSSTGHCALAGTTGFGGQQFQTVVLNPEVTCDNANLRPPTCTCRGDGSEIVISFIASKPPGLAGATRVIAATPVLGVIPSNPQQADVPRCAAGQVSSSSKPCVSG